MTMSLLKIEHVPRIKAANASAGSVVFSNSA